MTMSKAHFRIVAVLLVPSLAFGNLGSWISDFGFKSAIQNPQSTIFDNQALANPAAGFIASTEDHPTAKLSLSKRILHVDDDRGVRESIRNVLELFGYEVVSAAGGDAGFRILNEQRFDLLITDRQMDGGKDGFELIRLSKQFWPGMPTLLYSANTTAVSKGVGYGASAALLKGSPMEVLLAMIAKLLLAPTGGAGSGLPQQSIDLRVGGEEHWLDQKFANRGGTPARQKGFKFVSDEGPKPLPVAAGDDSYFRHFRRLTPREAGSVRNDPQELLKRLYEAEIYPAFYRTWMAGNSDATSELLLSICKTILHDGNMAEKGELIQAVLQFLDDFILPRMAWTHPEWVATLPKAADWVARTASVPVSKNEFLTYMSALSKMSFRGSLLFWMLNGVHKRSTVNLNQGGFKSWPDPEDLEADAPIFRRLIGDLASANGSPQAVIDGIAYHQALRALRNGLALVMWSSEDEAAAPHQAAFRLFEAMVGELPASIPWEKAARLARQAFAHVSLTHRLPDDLYYTSWNPKIRDLDTGFGNVILERVALLNRDILSRGNSGMVPLSALDLLTGVPAADFFQTYAVASSRLNFGYERMVRVVRFFRDELPLTHTTALDSAA